MDLSERPMQDPFEDADSADADMAQEEARSQQRGALQELVSSRIRRAVEARLNSGIEDIWRAAEDQYNGIDNLTTPDNQAPARWAGKATQSDPSMANRSTIFLNITKPKTDAAAARVQEMLIPHDDRPWEIGPTPIPELQQAVDDNIQTPISLADGTQQPAADVAKAAMLLAKDAAGKAETQIEDWFVEGRVYEHWRRVVRDSARLGSGVLKGPTPVMRKDRKLSTDSQNGSLLEITERLSPTSMSVSVWDAFPDPSCGEDIHAGAYFIERDYMTGRAVRDLAALPEYDRESIVQILREGPRMATSVVHDDRQQRELPGQFRTFDSDTFEVFYYYGDVPVETLVAGGWTIPGLLDAHGDDIAMAKQIEDALYLMSVPVVVTTINQRIVRITMNPLETGEFPFDIFPWEPVEGQPWGRGVPTKIAPAQRMLNGAARAMLENAGLSAGPQIVIDSERIKPANGRYEITGRKLWYWTPGEEVKDVRFAFQAVTIPSAQVELANIVKLALEMADQLTNLPMLMQGDMGAAPDNVGGMLMLESNAVSPLKVTAKLFDDRVVQPHLTRYYHWLLQDPDVAQEAKGDMQIRARGAGVLVMRDVYARVLPQLLPFVKDPDFELNPKLYMEQLLRSNKIDPLAISLTDEEVKAKREAMANNPPPMDPRVEAAHIRDQTEQRKAEMAAQRQREELQWKAAEAQMNREHDQVIKEVEREIQVMEFAGQREISFEQVRAMLAAKVLDVRNKREMFAAERQFAEGPGEGRGL